MNQDITLDALANLNQTPIDASASYHTVDIDVAPDPAELSAQAAQIDLLNGDAIAHYGEQSYRDMLAYGQQLLAHVRTNDFVSVNSKLAQLTNLVKNLNVEQMNSGGVFGKLSFLKSLTGGIRTFEKRFGQTLEESAQAEAELSELATALREDKRLYDELLSAKQPLASTVAVDVGAAKLTLDQAQDVSLPQLEAEAEVSDDDNSKQLVSNYRRRVLGFGNQYEDLKNTEAIFTEIAPRVVSIQANNLQLAEKLNQITGKIIPYWKSQIALAISMVKEQDLLKQKREDLKRVQKQLGGEEYGAAVHAEDLQLVDLDAVKKINNNLLSTISDAAMLQRAGQAVRLDTEATLLRLDGRIRQAMISAAAYGDDLDPEPVITEKKADPELARFEDDADDLDALDAPVLLEDDEVSELEDGIDQASADVAWELKEEAVTNGDAQLPLPDDAETWVNPESPETVSDEVVDGIDPHFGTYESPPAGDFEQTFEESVEFHEESPEPPEDASGEQSQY